MMLSLLLLAPAPVAAMEVARPEPIPVNRIAWMSEDDFPPDQLAAADPGFAARLDVGADGAAKRCTVTKSSGKGAFDARACAVLSERARWRPATDADGTPRASGYTFRLPWAVATKPVPRNTVNWITINDYPNAAMREERTGRVVVLAMVEADGRVSDCAVTTSSGHADLDAATCRAVTLRARYAPARDAAGEAMPSTAPFATRWQIPN